MPASRNNKPAGDRVPATRLAHLGSGSMWFSFDQTTRVVDVSDGVDVSDEVIFLGHRSNEFDLQVAAGLPNTNAIILAKAIQELNALLQHAVPGVAVRVLQALVLASSPFTEQDRSRVFAKEVSSERLFKSATEEHGGPRVLLLPAVEVAMAIASGTDEVGTDLRIGVGHRATSEWATFPGEALDNSSHWLAGAKPSSSSKEALFTTTWLILAPPDGAASSGGESVIAGVVLENPKPEKVSLSLD
jgi:hypothetical protein